MKNVAIIPARLGSKRIPNKNIRLFRGRPIMAYVIETALASCLFDAVFVSTESEEIRAVAEKYGATVHPRPASLADDATGTQEVMHHALTGMLAHEIDCQYACCIYPTAVLLRTEDLRRGLQAVWGRGARYAVSVGIDPYLHDAGQFYWGDARAFTNRLPLWAEHTVMVPMPASRSIDINVESDWARAEAMYEVIEKAAA